jgi:hypothetical protein
MKRRIPWWDRLNALLMPYIGPPPLGPYGEPPLPPTAAKPCPICGQPMSLHSVDRGVGHAPSRLVCPAQNAA